MTLHEEPWLHSDAITFQMQPGDIAYCLSITGNGPDGSGPWTALRVERKGVANTPGCNQRLP